MRDVRWSELCQWTEKQREWTAAADTHLYTLAGGSRGPGKSFWLRWYSLRFLLRCAAPREQGGLGLEGVRTMLACETFPDLRDRQIEKIRREFPPWLGHWHGGDYEFRLRPEFGAGVICCRNLDDASRYQSAEFALIAVDELTKNPLSAFHALRGSLRWPGVERCQFIAATNPNGLGAPWVRRLWVERDFPEEMQHLAGEFVFRSGLPQDNPHLPASYIDNLRSLPTILRRAWLEGDWYAGVEGLVLDAFSDANLTDDDYNPSLPIELAVDDGYVDPRAIAFIQRTGARILVFDELYHTGHLAEKCVHEVLERCIRYAGKEPPADADSMNLSALAAWCGTNGVRLPEIAVGSPEAKELHARLRQANIPVRNQQSKIVDRVPVMQRLVCDGQGYRALQVNRRCRNLIAEATESWVYPEGARGTHEKPADGGDHLMEALSHYAWVRARR